MFINNTARDQYRPSARDLADCYAVHANGEVHNPKMMRDWAMAHCTSLLWWEHTDMSDISSWHGPDDCVSFYFQLESDFILFKLKWS